jgi:2,4-dienoyl-CoA reductase-like NADH-dependent reductase (Old Yellow Enzyme family)
MQPGQCGIDADDKIGPWAAIVSRVRETDNQIRLFMQISHAGRQTRTEFTGLPVVGVSTRRCGYFRQTLRVLEEAAVSEIVEEYAQAARRAKEAGFDGVQVHGAHGYLVHQFLSPWTNNRRDKWGDGPRFLEAVIQAIRRTCGNEFAVLTKLSAADDNTPGIRIDQTIATVKRLEALDVDAVEISYGTMEAALNIIRGACPVDTILRVNPLFNRIPVAFRAAWKKLFLGRYRARLIPFSEDYNVEAAARIKKQTAMAVLAVGGIRTPEGMLACVTRHGLDGVSLCRPLICEPDLPLRLRDGSWTRSACTSCNLCTVHTDSPHPLRCYEKKGSA